MRSKIIITVAILALISICSAAAISQSAISSIIQDIMSPAKTERAMSLINAAARTSNDCSMPARIANELPTVLARRQPGRIAEENLPRIVQADGTSIIDPRLIRTEFLYPSQKIIKPGRDSQAYNTMNYRQVYQNAPVALPRENVVYNYCQSNQPSNYVPVASPTFDPYLPVATPLCPYMPVATPNPFLPVASPLSSYLPSLVPPPTQSRGQFLRKIPIPPPTI